MNGNLIINKIFNSLKIKNIEFRVKNLNNIYSKSTNGSNQLNSILKKEIL